MFTKRPVRNGNSSRQDAREYHKDFAEVMQPIDEADVRPHQERRNGYMAELEAWLDEAVFSPITDAVASEDSKELHLAFNEATAQIKRKVLASYHNGLKARSNARQSD